MTRSLDQWINYIQTIHHREIELTLDRVREVYLRMYPNGLMFKIVSLSGTNGKGSTSELLASVYREAGYSVGKFTSPHLVHFSERFNLDGRPVENEPLLRAFSRVEAARGTVPITFFEFGTLLAIDLFASSKVDVAIMEVGLGGRLDSVNILDAHVSLITGVSIDHTNWLGDTIEKIAYEKTGIARKGRPLILGLSHPPESMLDYATEIGADISIIHKDFSFKEADHGDAWEWSSAEQTISHLPLPYGQAGVQLGNSCLALKAIEVLSNALPVEQVEIRRGIERATIEGRCQILQRQPYIVLDVSHNQASVARLVQFIAELKLASNAKIIAICGMLLDKEIKVSLEPLNIIVDEWYSASIHNERGASAQEINQIIRSISDAPTHEYENVEDAYDSVIGKLTSDDCLLVFGSFHIVGDILAHVK